MYRFLLYFNFLYGFDLLREHYMVIEASAPTNAKAVDDVPLERKRLGEWMFGDVIGNGSSGKVRFCYRDKNPGEKVDYLKQFNQNND